MCWLLGPLVSSYVLHRHAHAQMGCCRLHGIFSGWPGPPGPSGKQASGLSSIWLRLRTVLKLSSQARYPPHWLSSLTLAGDHTLTRTPSLAAVALWTCGSCDLRSHSAPSCCTQTPMHGHAHRLKSPSPRQKEQMKKLNKPKQVDERLLFHGTNVSHVPAICEQNFDWRICGTHGTMYGKGSYFARDASYSHDYCSSHNGRYSMFVALVLVGDFVEGKPEYVRPPLRARDSNRLYDSCVNDLTDPSIFVIFEKHQIYPAYILEYSNDAQCMIL
ncbi:protein mono-ADP-ribosyltransferase PARP12-like isoform X2 [Phalacrocorax aristotelis]|uniref:protein mono-ADP-ribosyltransferase PARP12-like isoform X2 n=1 Tax=Phalacrocorax aristotelis TaxID=126867 RepID=UPI003F4C02B5